MTQNNPNKWQYTIVSADFPFADDSSQKKARPALCLSEPIGKYNEVVVAFITSKIPFHKIQTDYTLEKEKNSFKTTGLNHTSTIRLHKLTTANAGTITKVFGRLEDQEAKEAIKQKLSDFLFDD